MHRQLLLSAAVATLCFGSAAQADTWSVDVAASEARATDTGTDMAYCALPGEQVVEDGAGDATTGVSGHDVTGVFVAEPAALMEKIAVTLKMADLNPVAPPNTIYYVNFLLSDGNEYFFSYDPYALVEDAFSYGHVEVGPGGVGNLTTDGPTDPESSAAADGTITWVLTKSRIRALPDSTDMSNIIGQARLLIGAAGTGLVTTVDDGGGGFYELRGNESCVDADAKVLGMTVGAVPAGGLAVLALAALAGLRRRRAR